MSTKILSGIYTSAYALSSPITTLSVAASGYLAAGLSAAGAGTYTIVNDGHIRGLSGAVALAGRGVVTNAGTINSFSTTAGAGVMLGNGGVVTNKAGALIDGYDGVVIEASAGTVFNDGKVIATGTYGILLQDGGNITNGSATDTGALLQGSIGFVAQLGATVHNYGTIASDGTTGAGGYLKDGGLFTNGSASDTTALVEAQGLGVAANNAAGTVINYGTVHAHGTSSAAVILEDGGSITNGSTKDTKALLTGDVFGVADVAQAATMTNFGTVIGGYETSGDYGGVYFKDGGVVTNGSATDKTAFISGLFGVGIETAPGTVTNFGGIGGLATEIGVAIEYGGLVTNGASTDTTAQIQALLPVFVIGKSGTVQNFGTITGNQPAAAFTTQVFSVAMEAGGSVTNGSGADTKALITGQIGVYFTGTATGTVTNFGSIVTTQAGVGLTGGGKVTNGSGADTTALIQSDIAGVVLEDVAGTVVNFGSIVAGMVAPAYGVWLQAGGSATNGSSADHTALIQGFIGVNAVNGAATITNDAVIRGDAAYGSVGVLLSGDSKLTNNAGALISAYVGVVAGPSDTATNFGTIQGLDGVAVNLSDATARLNAESGSVFEGQIEGGAGVVDIVGGLVTASGVVSSGKVEGAGTLSLNGGVSEFDAGATLTVTKVEVGGTGTVVDVDTKINDSKLWVQSAGTLSVATGDQITFTGKGDSFSGTVDGAGTIAWNGGTDTFSAVSLSAAKMTISTAAVTLSNSVNITGTLTATTKSLVVAAGGATLAGGELLLTDNATNSLHGASSSAVLTNDGTIKGAGQVGGGTMSLVNSGTIESAYATALTINTGTKTIVNSGEIEAVGTGGLLVDGAVDNSGTLASSNSTLTVDGAVTGAGLARVFGGKVIFNGTFTENVLFGSSGELVLAHSTGFTGAVSNFSKTGTNSFDLEDISFATATESYSGTSASGVLTVTDGTHTAKIHLTGDYTASTWDLSADSGTGTIVKDPTKTGQAPPAVHAMIAAAASFGAAAASSAPAHGPPPTHADLLAFSHG